jgi:hypothetical protein
VKIGRQTTPPGDDTLSWRGELILPVPFTPDLDPSTNGVRLVLTQETSTLLDALIPAGPYAGSPPAGWRVARSGTRWTYANRSATPANGITKVTVRNVLRIPGLLKIRVKGKHAALPPGTLNPPIGAVVVLDPPVATTGQCGEAVLACTFNASATTRRCR